MTGSMRALMETVSQLETFSNWVRPTDSDSEHEYRIAYANKPSKRALLGNPWPTVQDYQQAIRSAKVVTVTPQLDNQIEHRSNTDNREDLVDLISSYQSYPKHRNEQTVDAIYDGFEQDRPMKMPIIARWPNGRMRVLTGNTRMDIAFQLGINPQVLMIELGAKE